MVRRRHLPSASQASLVPAQGGHAAQPAAVPGAPGRVQPSEPHEQGPGTGHAGTQLLPAANKGCLMPGTAGCLWALTGSRINPREHGTALPPTTTLSPAPHGAWVAQDQAMALSTSSRSGCSGAQPPSLCTGPHISAASSPVLVVDVVSKARGVNDRQLHANPLLFYL